MYTSTLYITFDTDHALLKACDLGIYKKFHNKIVWLDSKK